MSSLARIVVQSDFPARSSAFDTNRMVSAFRRGYQDNANGGNTAA